MRPRGLFMGHKTTYPQRPILGEQCLLDTEFVGESQNNSMEREPACTHFPDEAPEAPPTFFLNRAQEGEHLSNPRMWSTC